MQQLIESNALKDIIDTAVVKDLPMVLPGAVTKVIAFVPDMLPESISKYVVDVAERQQCPIDFVAVTALCGLSAVLGRKVLICPKQNDDWTITPNLWGAIIGRPSAMKSPAMKAALEPLKIIEAESAKQYEISSREYEVSKDFTDLAKKRAKDQARKQMEDGKDDDARVTLSAASFIESAPTRKRLTINDASVEKLGELLNENVNGLILVRDELSGWISKLTREDCQSERAFYLECFDGDKPYIYDRIGRGTIDIKNTTLSIIGGIQPSKIIPLVCGAVKGINDDGLLQRLQLAVYPDDNKNWKWIDRIPHEEARKNYFTVFEKLNELNFKTENSESVSLRFTPDAQLLFVKWVEEHQKISRTEEIHPALESYLLKLPATIASIALIFQIIRNEQSLNVDVAAITQALLWADYLISHAERLYGSANQDLIGAHLILKRLNKLDDEFTARIIQRKGWSGLSDMEAIQGALEFLVDYKHLIAFEIPTTSVGGRPTTYYRKNNMTDK